MRGRKKPPSGHFLTSKGANPMCAKTGTLGTLALFHLAASYWLCPGTHSTSAFPPSFATRASTNSKSLSRFR